MGAVRIRQSIREFATQPVILWILLGGKPKWLPLNFRFNDVIHTAPILFFPFFSVEGEKDNKEEKEDGITLYRGRRHDTLLKRTIVDN